MARVRKLEIKARRLVRESFSGEYQSSFRGQGLDFDDFREYQHGDEVRFIDWNVTARMGTARSSASSARNASSSVVLAVDVSGSADYGSVHLSKREVAAETAAVLGFSALDNGDKVGLLLFADEPLALHPAGKGQPPPAAHGPRDPRRPSRRQPGTSIAAACDFLVRTLRRRAARLPASPTSSPTRSTSRSASSPASTRPSPCASSIRSRSALPKAGQVIMIDPETGFETLVNTNNPNLRMGYEKLMRRQPEGVKAVCRKHGIDLAQLSTDRDRLRDLHRLLKSAPANEPAKPAWPRNPTTRWRCGTWSRSSRCCPTPACRRGPGRRSR